MVTRFKKQLLFSFLIIFCATGIKPMEPEDNICSEINTISPDAPESEYLSLMQRMKNKGESVCSCIKNIIGKRIKESEVAIEREWGITQDNWNKVNNVMSQTIARDSKPGKVEVVVDPSLEKLPAGLTDLIVNRIKKTGFTNGKITIKHNESTHLMGVSREVSANYYSSGQLEMEADDSYIVHIESFCFNRDPRALIGTVLHEIQHIEEHDAIKRLSLFFIAIMNNSSLHSGQSTEDAFSEFKNSRSLKQHSRSIEARADQIPAACGCGAADSHFIEIDNRELANMITRRVTTIDDAYDDIATRLAMSTRIRKLKQAEKKLEKLSKE